MSRFVALLCLLALLVPMPSWGDPGASADQDTFNVYAHQPAADGSTEAVHTSGVASTEYQLQVACEDGAGGGAGFLYGCGGQDACGDDGETFLVWALYPNGTNEIVGTQCHEPGTQPTAQSVTPGLALRAFRRIPLPESNVVIQPPGGETLVNFDTVFSTEADDFTRTIGLLGHRVELRIEATSFDWVNGDGTTRSTNWQGRKWTRGASVNNLITHRYDDAEQGLRPRVDTTWSATYRVDGGPWRDVPGTVTMTGAAYDLTVLSASPALAG